MRWYLEEYLIAPYSVYETRGEAIHRQLGDWGQALFNALFAPGSAAHEAYARAGDVNAIELILSSNSASFLSLPWELMKDPQRTGALALSLKSLDRTFTSVAAAADQASSSEALRVLMVISRPYGLNDVAYQIIARRLLERLETVRGRVELDVVRPPTLEALEEKLRIGEEEGRLYQILHFDGHGAFGSRASSDLGSDLFNATEGEGFVFFEHEDGKEHRVSSSELALVVNRASVPLVVLNSCRSGTVGEAAAEAAVATRLLEGGAASVVAMGYSVYAVAAAEFMAALYEALFTGNTVSEAVSAGRRRMNSNNERPSPKGPLRIS